MTDVIFKGDPAAGFQMLIARIDDKLLTLRNAPCSMFYKKMILMMSASGVCEQTVFKFLFICIERAGLPFDLRKTGSYTAKGYFIY